MFAEAADVGDAEGCALQQLEKVRNQLVGLDQDTADPQRLQRLPQAAREALIGKVRAVIWQTVVSVLLDGRGQVEPSHGSNTVLERECITAGYTLCAS